MSWFEAADRAVGIAAHHIQVFIPSLDRDGDPIPKGQPYWVHECVSVLTDLFGGATAFPPSRGAWKDPESGELLHEDTVIVFSYAETDRLTTPNGARLFDFVLRLGRETKQGEVGVLVDGRYCKFQEFH